MLWDDISLASQKLGVYKLSSSCSKYCKISNMLSFFHLIGKGLGGSLGYIDLPSPPKDLIFNYK